MFKHFRIRYTFLVSLLVVFGWWGIKSFKRFWSQPLTTDISYTFGDYNKSGIKFPTITFCEYMTGQVNQLLKDCNNGAWDFFPSLINCLEKNKNFDIDTFIDNLETKRVTPIDEVKLWTGSYYIDLKNKEHLLWSRVFHYQFGLCYSFDLSNLEEFEYVKYEEISRPGISFTLLKNNPWSRIDIILHSKNDFPDAWLLNGKTTLWRVKSSISKIYRIPDSLDQNILPCFTNSLLVVYNTRNP